MRVRLDQLVAAALQQGSAVPAFTCYDFTTALAVVAAAEDAGRGAILLVSPSTAATPNGLRLIAALRGLADSAAVPVAVQLDHASDLGVIADAVGAGADSVLVDGSSLDYEDNIALVQAARTMLDDAGSAETVIEAELGGLAGDEDRAFGADAAGSAPAAGLTDSAQVEDFVARTGAQLLAVAVGNVHGRYQGEPELRWDVLQDIAVRTRLPLVLHGASGIPAAELVKAAAMNVGKVNFNTELRTGVLETLEARTGTHRQRRRKPSGIAGRMARLGRNLRGHGAGHALALTPPNGSATRRGQDRNMILASPFCALPACAICCASTQKWAFRYWPRARTRPTMEANTER